MLLTYSSKHPYILNKCSMMVSFTALLTKTIKLVFTVSLLSFNIKNKIKDCYGNSQDIVPDWSHMSTCAAVVVSLNRYYNNPYLYVGLIQNRLSSCYKETFICTGRLFFSSYITDSAIFLWTLFPKVAGHSQNRSKMYLLKGGVDGFGYFFFDFQLLYFLTRIIHGLQ